ncbi:MAG: hypothetical protein HFH68_13660 [Lachnospiraceae bacterium]|nr:hypothetical protein [Lachnospiraceae bacterium]
MITLKQLVYKEICEMKERRKKETFGTYYIFYILTIIYTIMTPVVIPVNGTFDMLCIYIFLWIGYTSIWFLYQYLYIVKENGTIQNIFLKYQFIPVDMDTLFLAKIIALARFIIIHILPAQVLAFIYKAYCTYKYGCKFFDIPLFLPAISGIIYFLILSIIIYKYRRAAIP